MKKKNLIICIHPYSTKGGATNKIIKLLNNLINKNFDIVYLYLKKNLDLKLNSKVKVIHINSSRTLLSLFKIKNVIHLYNKKNYQNKFFISNQNYSNILVKFLLKDFGDFKSILIERNHIDELYFYNSFLDFFKKLLIKILMKSTYKYAYKIIGNTKKLSKDLSRFVNKQVETIYSPTNFKEI